MRIALIRQTRLSGECSNFAKLGWWSRSIFHRQFATSVHRSNLEASPVAPSLSGNPKNVNEATLPNELMQLIHTHIKTHGPLPLPRYISLCLSHPTLGYYTRAKRSSSDSSIIGKHGDFVTSPEISQVFGELLSVWFITQWQAQGKPARARIIELGPGKGTLMDDVLRTFRSIKAFRSVLEDVHLVDTSAFMRKEQEEKLSKHRSDINFHWHDRIQDIPAEENDAFTMVLAHEFFDALPFHLFEKRPEGFREIFVDIDSGAITVDPRQFGNPPQKLRYVVSPAATAASRLLLAREEAILKGMSDGGRIEVCAEAYEVAMHAAKLVGRCGAGLIIDYGDDRHFGNSFRAFKQHKLVEPLAEPGFADLTSNVNFKFLRDALLTTAADAQAVADTETRLTPFKASKSAEEIASLTEAVATASANSTETIFVPPLLSQRSFLLSLGLQPRVQRLVDESKTRENAENIYKSAQRLVEKSEQAHGMGKTFKVLGFVPRSQSSDKQKVFPFGSELD